MGGKRTPDSEYNPQWWARILESCTRLPTGCLVWEKTLTWNGYPQANYRGKNKTIHRVLYQITHGPLPSSVDVCHRCDVRNCVEITHLWAGTRKENMQDCSAKGRADGQWKTHCWRGHEFTLENTYYQPRTGLRNCRTCQRERQRARAA